MEGDPFSYCRLMYALVYSKVPMYTCSYYLHWKGSLHWILQTWGHLLTV